MKTYLEHAQKQYPVGSKWKRKTVEEVYEVTELIDAGLMAVVKLESKNSIHCIPSCDIHLEYIRL